MTPAPIAILSFNRPHYLEPVLASLAAQQEIAERVVHLFQDGAVNRYSGKRWAEDVEIDACVALFRRYFPHGVLHISPDNIGICENFRRAEQVMFEALDGEVAYFFEDDMVVSPYYLETLDRLYGQIESIDRIVYFAAYGHHRVSPAEQSAKRRELGQLHHSWAFGLKRNHWRDMQKTLAPYYALVCGSDYRDRPRTAIRRYFASIGMTSAHTSQDAAKAIATILLRRWRCNTIPTLGRYIGETGVHGTPAFYARQGFGATELFAEKLESFNIPEYRKLRGFIRSYDEAFRKDQAEMAEQLLPEERMAMTVRQGFLLRLWRELERRLV
jgi:glycosyltransferase involved in cell wall biosynthesis